MSAETVVWTRGGSYSMPGRISQAEAVAEAVAHHKRQIGCHQRALEEIGLGLHRVSWWRGRSELAEPGTGRLQRADRTGIKPS